MKEIEILIFILWFYISILVFEKNKNGYIFQCAESMISLQAKEILLDSWCGSLEITIRTNSPRGFHVVLVYHFNRNLEYLVLNISKVFLLNEKSSESTQYTKPLMITAIIKGS